MRIFTKRFSILFLVVFTLTAIFFSGPAQASLWDMIRAWVTINPLIVDVSAPKKVEVDKVFLVKAKVENKGGERIEKVEGVIFFPGGLELETKKTEKQEIGTIPPYKEKTISWPVRGKNEGNYFISVKVSGELKEQLINAEDTTMVKIIKKSFPGKGRPLDLFQRFFDFLQGRFGF